MRILLALLLSVASITFVQAQSFSVSGSVTSAKSKETLPGATVLLIRLPDSVKTATGTDKDGAFRFPSVAPGQYALQVNYLGHATLTKAVRVQNAALSLGALGLEEGSTNLQEIRIVGQIPPGTQKGDTTVFNAAAFKVANDASAEDLVTKLPGVTIVDGKIQAQGEEIRQVLVDGKRFFGEDANTALRNLPAEVIENIEIFDKKSDQAEFSGFDDGNKAKTINVVTKPNRRQGQFGKASIGIGPDKKYMAGTSVNIFKGDRRFTFNGLTNNINMQDFSVGEAPGGGMRGRRGAGGGGGNGISTTNTLGLNYSDLWGKKIEVSGNYNYSNNTNENNRLSYRDYFNSQFYEQENTDNSFNSTQNENHQLNLRLDYKINDRNRLLISPRVSIQNNNSASNSIGRSIYDRISDNEVYDEAILTSTDNESNSDNYSYNLSNNINFSHRFNKPGRTVNVGLNTDYSINNGDIYRIINVVDYEQPDKSKYLNQYTKADRNGLNWRGNVALSEQVSEKARVQAEYSISNRFETSERLTYDWGETDYTNFNGLLSNAFDSDYLTQQGKTSYQYNSDKVRVQLETLYQMANLQNEQEYPSIYQMNRTFHNVLPMAQFEYKFTKTKNLQFDFRTNTNAPNVTQLQEVVDNTNPLRFRTGNDDLVQSYQYSANVRFRSFNTETNRNFTFFMTASKTDDFITNSTTELGLENEPLLEGFVISRGAQFIRPVNLDGNWNARTFFSYGQPIKIIKSNINLTGSIGYNKTPGLFNNEMFFSTSTNFGLGGSLSSNISENVDFNISTNSNYNLINNTLPSRNQQNNNFFNQSTQLRANLRFWKGVVYRTELNHQMNRGLSSGFNTTYTLLNMSLSKKMLKNQRGEVSLSVNDLLRQNISVQRSITDAFVQDVQSTVLQRFFMLTFSYNIRSFGGASMPGERGPGQRTPGERGMRQGGGQGGGQGNGW